MIARASAVRFQLTRPMAVLRPMSVVVNSLAGLRIQPPAQQTWRLSPVCVLPVVCMRSLWLVLPLWQYQAPAFRLRLPPSQHGAVRCTTLALRPVHTPSLTATAFPLSPLQLWCLYYGLSHLMAKVVRGPFLAVLHKELKKTFRRWAQVTKDDKWALEDYTSSGYGLMNVMLRQGPTDEAMQRRVKDVCKALHRVGRKSQFKGIVKRGSGNIPDMDGLKAGATFTDAGFFSTSYGTGFPGDLQFIVESKTGINVTPYSRHKCEQEILFLPGTMFRITEVVRKGNTTFVGMYEFV
jgi:hypothetical protein